MAISSTWVALQTTVVSSTTQSVVLSDIPQAYTDLVLVVNLKSGIDDAFLYMRPNGSTASSYSFTTLYGDGNSTYQGIRGNGDNRGWIGAYISGSTVLGEYSAELNIFNYADTNDYKSWLARAGRASSAGTYEGTETMAGQWAVTDAITSLTIGSSNSGIAQDIGVGSTFTLYGVARATNGNGTARATGGTISYDNYGYVYHTFTSSGTFTPSQAITADVLQIAGGGAGGISSGAGGGAGAGGVSYVPSVPLIATGYNVTVGAGGTQGIGASGSYSYSQVPSSGVNSQFGSLTAAVGGGKGGGFAPYESFYLNGGSGGGGYGGGQDPGLGTSGQGNRGGNGQPISPYYGGGGGGAGASGADGTSGVLCVGGAGTSRFTTWGTATSTGHLSNGVRYYAGGGGGSLNSSSGGAGGVGGGGAGAVGNKVAGTNGTANTGGGGGASANSEAVTTYGSYGGSGIVIVRYLGV